MGGGGCFEGRLWRHYSDFSTYCFGALVIGSWALFCARCTQRALRSACATFDDSEGTFHRGSNAAIGSLCELRRDRWEVEYLFGLKILAGEALRMVGRWGRRCGGLRFDRSVRGCREIF